MKNGHFSNENMPEIFGQKHPGYEKFSLRNFNFLTEKIDFEIWMSTKVISWSSINKNKINQTYLPDKSAKTDEVPDIKS